MPGGFGLITRILPLHQMSYTTVMINKLERYIQTGLLVILALMPFHAFLSVWLGHIFGHESEIEAWKELVLLALTARALLLIRADRQRLERLRRPWIVATGIFALLALAVTAITRPGLTAAAFGIKTDLEFLLAAVLATLVAAPTFMRRSIHAVLIGAGAVTSFGLLEIFVLPRNFLDAFGYGPATLMPYELISGTNTPRFAATLGGPNQLGTYLILPLALSLMLAIRRKQWWWLALTATGSVVLAATYSRSAWIGAVAALALTLVVSLPTRWRMRTVAVLVVLGVAGAGSLAVLPTRHTHCHAYLFHQNPASANLRPSSDAQHVSSVRTSLRDIAGRPLGHGLGSAGPATFRAGVVHIVENYYLPIGYENGVAR